MPRQRLVGLSFGGLTSARRGQGSDVAGSRPYQPGDDVDAIDWNASARLSSARGTDEFVVREKFAEEAPHVVVVADHRPEMDAYPPHLPWVSKPLAMRHATQIVFDSALAIRGVAGYLDLGDGGEPFWKPPRAQHDPIDLDERKRYDAPTDNIELALAHLVEHRRSLPVGSFVFVLSDFLGGVSGDSWTRVLLQRWDVVPVVVQDPVWEQSFPPIGGVVVRSGIRRRSASCRSGCPTRRPTSSGSETSAASRSSTTCARSTSSPWCSRRTRARTC